MSDQSQPSAPPPQQRTLLVTQSIHYRNVYATVFRLNITEDTATIVCANDENAPDDSVIRVEEVRVTMTPKKAKALLVHLQVMIEEYEARFREIPIPPDLPEKIRAKLKRREPSAAPEEGGTKDEATS